jgi:hypothetical protein
VTLGSKFARVSVVASNLIAPPRPRSAERAPRYPRLTSGSLLALAGMGLATSCGGAGPGYSRDAGADAGAQGNAHLNGNAADAGTDAGDAGDAG